MGRESFLDGKRGLNEVESYPVHVAPFSLVSRVTQILQSNQCFDFCPQRVSLFSCPGIESGEQMN